MLYLLTIILLIIFIIVKVNHDNGPWEHSCKVVKGAGISKKIIGKLQIFQYVQIKSMEMDSILVLQIMVKVHY